MQSPGADSEKVAKALGFSFDELRKTIQEKGLVAGLELLQEKTGGNAQAIAKLIPSVEAQRAVFALLGGDVSKLNGFLADFNEEANAGGQVAAAFEARARTLDGSIEALGTSANKAKIALVDGIKGPLIEITEESRGQIDALRDWLTANRNLMESGFGQWLSGVKSLLEGVEPAARAVVEAMREVGIDLAEAFPKPVTDEVVHAADVVVTMGCGDSCPWVPAKRREDWGLPDPREMDDEGYRAVRDDISARVKTLLAQL